MVFHRLKLLKKKQELIYGARELPPADFLLKIESFSGLAEMINNQKKNKYYESCSFEAGGFNWRFRLLVLRANRVHEKKIISVYLVLDESNNILATDSDVIANFKFFVYDQIRDNYLTVEDADNRYKRFNKRETCQGFSNVISLTRLKCASNGYLVNDSCVFGVEVQVIKNTRTAECLSVIEKDNFSRSWKISNFSKRNAHLCDPHGFTVAGRSWRIEIHTNYIHGLLCMKLKLDDTSYRALAGLMRWLRGENNQRLFAMCRLGVKNQLHADQDQWSYKGWWFNPEPPVVPWALIIDMKDLQDESKGFLVDDVLIVEAEIEWMFASTDIIVDGKKLTERN
ncbi:hypothetical protein ACET3Z_019710 [Daucus carota]